MENRDLQLNEQQEQSGEGEAQRLLTPLEVLNRAELNIKQDPQIQM